MDKELIIDKLTGVFRNVFNDDTISINDTTTAKDIGSWNSLSHMIMISEVEKSFEVKFKLREISKLNNVGALIDLIETKVQN